MQHLATWLGTTCCIRLATLLWCIATRWMMLDQLSKRSNSSCSILDVAWCCTRLATSTQNCSCTACAHLLCTRGPGHINIDRLHTFGQPIQHMWQHHATIMLQVFGKAFSGIKMSNMQTYWLKMARMQIILKSTVHYLFLAMYIKPFRYITSTFNVFSAKFKTKFLLKKLLVFKV